MANKTESDSDLDAVVTSIEAKLKALEQKRDHLRRDIDLKRAEIRDLTHTLTMVRDLEDRLDE